MDRRYFLKSLILIPQINKLTKSVDVNSVIAGACYIVDRIKTRRERLYAIFDKVLKTIYVDAFGFWWNKSRPLEKLLKEKYSEKDRLKYTVFPVTVGMPSKADGVRESSRQSIQRDYRTSHKGSHQGNADADCNITGRSTSD